MTLKSLLGHVTFMAIFREKNFVLVPEAVASTQSPYQTISNFVPI